MTVALSLLTLTPGAPGGTETYVRELCRALAATPSPPYVVVHEGGEDLAGGLPARVVPGVRLAGDGPARLAGLGRLLTRSSRLRHHTAGADVVHFPLTVPLPSPGPRAARVVTLHDVLHHDLPDLFSRTERAYRAVAYDRAAREADAVITVSAFSRERALATLGLDPRRVHVAPHGVRATASVSPPAARRRFLLYPAKGWPHKDHRTLLRAWPSLLRVEPGLRLVLTGVRPDELPPLPKQVEARGRVPEAELAALYREAAALVFPSRYEGFGLPVLEAMAAGCPVVAADAGALPEVVGDAGVLFRAGDPDDLVRAVLEVLGGGAPAAERSVQRLQQFTWASSAQAHLKTYAAVGP